jgi:hypothetical protein
MDVCTPRAPQAPPRRRVSKKRIAAYIGTLLMVLSLTRTSVLFLESLAMVRDERHADSELIGLCKTGAARGSAKMREACLRARADNASPVVLKATVRAFSVAWGEFVECVSTPFGFSTTILFVISGLVLPIIPWLKAALAMWGGAGAAASSVLSSMSGDDDDYDDVEGRRHSVIVMNGTGVSTRSSVKRRVARLLKGSESPPRRVVELPACDDYGGWAEVGLKNH